VIGDVCGKGAEAAAVTALARYTIRAAVLHSRDPIQVLSELNEAILRQGLEYRFCTVLYAALCPEEGGMQANVATGGHPLPFVVRADGSVETAGRAGTLLGIVADPQIEAEETFLRHGDTMVLYTDGVIEATPTDDRFGPERFADFLSGLAGRDAAEVAREVERVVLDVQAGAPRDDVAVLVVRVTPPGGEPFAAAGGGVAATA
jgi:serine phosphatase RsbU (regulator of sigma subunit)